MFGRMLGPTSAAAGTVKGTEYVLEVPLTKTVPREEDFAPAAVVRPSAALVVVVVAETRAEAYSNACIRLDRIIMVSSHSDLAEERRR